MVDVVISTRNSDKLREIKSILQGIPIRIQSLLDHPSIPPILEDGSTLLANALKKAKVVLEATGMWTIADDTGLFVEELDGIPGVQSARYAGENATYEQNRLKLLAALDNVPWERRRASFLCYIVLAISQNNIEVFKGKVDGYITEREIGTGGFGYDPVFMLPDTGKTFAELLSQDKNTVSHRAIALSKLRSRLREILS